MPDTPSEKIGSAFLLHQVTPVMRETVLSPEIENSVLFLKLHGYKICAYYLSDFIESYLSHRNAGLV